jgi:hypothetical protein
MVAIFVTVALAFYGLYTCLGGRPFAGVTLFSEEFDARSAAP